MDWRKFLTIASDHMAINPCEFADMWSWCAWTTFERLGGDAGYWTAPLPLEVELQFEGTSDGGTWGQPFRYSQLAHLIVPRHFIWESYSADYSSGTHQQDLDGLSVRLWAEGITHRLSDYVLEVKLY